MLRNIFICHTPYHIYTATKKAMVARRRSDAVSSILVVDTTPNVDEIFDNLCESGVFSDVVLVKHAEVFAGWTNNSYLKSRLLLRFSRKTRDSLSFLQEYDGVYIFNDLSDIGAYLHNSKTRYHLLEDGLDCFAKYDQNAIQFTPHPLAKRLIRKATGIPNGMGQSPLCIDIEVNSTRVLLTKMSRPVIEAPRRELDCQINDADIEVLNGIFSFSDFTQPDCPVALVLTSPLEVHGSGFNESDQLNMYRNVVDALRGYHVFVKPHPRDKTDYRELEAGKCHKVQVLERAFPVELLALNSRFSCDLALVDLSTAAGSLSFAKKVMELKDFLAGFEALKF